MGPDRTAAALDDQLSYYRRAAPYYDRRYAGHALIDQVVAWLRARTNLSGATLEMACGAGQWTVRLAESARFVTAVDAAPEMLEFARRRLAGPLAGRVELVCADVFSWRPGLRYDTVFFAFWLSHVPPARLDAFWQLVEACLAPGGRAAFVDTGPQEAAFEDELDSDADLPTARRRLADGSEYRVVKVLHDPDRLAESLAGLGWAAKVVPMGQTFFVGWSAPAPPS